MGKRLLGHLIIAMSVALVLIPNNAIASYVLQINESIELGGEYSLLLTRVSEVSGEYSASLALKESGGTRATITKPKYSLVSLEGFFFYVAYVDQTYARIDVVELVDELTGRSQEISKSSLMPYGDYYVLVSNVQIYRMDSSASFRLYEKSKPHFQTSIIHIVNYHETTGSWKLQKGYPDDAGFIIESDKHTVDFDDNVESFIVEEVDSTAETVTLSPISSLCGDGLCNDEYGETQETCCSDCGTPALKICQDNVLTDSCGNGLCESLYEETQSNCCSDCGTPALKKCENNELIDTCGNDECESEYGEDKTNCCSDCGPGLLEKCIENERQWDYTKVSIIIIAVVSIVLIIFVFIRRSRRRKLDIM